MNTVKLHMKNKTFHFSPYLFNGEIEMDVEDVCSLMNCTEEFMIDALKYRGFVERSITFTLINDDNQIYLLALPKTEVCSIVSNDNSIQASLALKEYIKCALPTDFTIKTVVIVRLTVKLTHLLAMHHDRIDFQVDCVGTVVKCFTDENFVYIQTVFHQE